MLQKIAKPLVLFTALALPLTALGNLNSPEGAAVAFDASGPGGLKIEGKTSELRLADDGTTVTITVPLSNLDTGIGLRNKHMREKYLEVGKFPNAVLAVPKAQLKFPEGETSGGSAQGTMSIHGKSRPVTFSYKARKVGEKLAINGSVPLNINDFGIEVPSYLGVTVKPDITVRAAFTASP